MHKGPQSFALPFSPYPSPPSLASSDNSYQLQEHEDYLSSMGANADINVDGIGVLNYQRAIDIARNSEGDLDPTVSAYLEGALTDIWTQINLQPETYVMTKDQFAVFNFYRQRFEGNPVAEQAIARYWLNTHEASAAS